MSRSSYAAARWLKSAVFPVAALACAPALATPFFLNGDVVVSVEGYGVPGASSGPYGDDQAAPLALFQYVPTGTVSATFVNALVLPQNNSGTNFAVSGEYGSNTEGSLQLSGDGRYLAIAGYGVNAATFNASPATYSPSSTNTKLGQSGSLTGQGYTPVPRVVALIDANGNVNSTTALYNVFNANNPRSVYTADGTNIYISGQGATGDNTGGVFFTTLGSASATSITGNDGGSGSSQDTRTVQVYNGQLYVSTDSQNGSTNRSFIGTLGTGTPTTVANSSNGPAMLSGFGNTGGTGKYTITAATTNGINSSGQQINLSPENYFFANPTTLYVADSGNPKQSSASSSLGDGGLQKWSLVDGNWQLDYTLAQGLGLVANSNSHGVTGLMGLAGQVSNNVVELYATSSTINDVDQTYLYGITDVLSATTEPNGESFAVLADAPGDSTFKGVSLAPVPEPSTLALLAPPIAWLLTRRRKFSPLRGKLAQQRLI